jgi:predicted ATPase
LLLTYRPEALQLELQQWLTELDRQRLTQEITLTPLARADTDRMVRTILGLAHTVNTELLDTLYTLSEGNPFFVEELLKTFMTTGELQYFDGGWLHKSPKTSGEASVPRSVHLAVQERVKLLSSEAKQVLTLAAVAGRRFDFTLLQQALHCDENFLLSCIKELINAQLVVEHSADDFAFRHALSREAVYSQLLKRERQNLHRTLVETLQLSPLLGERYLGDLAVHSYEAGLWEQAAFYEYQLGEQALRLYAQRSAIKHLTRAIEASQHLASSPSSKFYYTRGQAYATLGEFDHARSDYEQALDFAHKAGDGLLKWQVMLALGFLWFGRDYAKAGEWLRQSIELAERLADPILKARSLNRLGNCLANTGRLEESLQAHGDALRLLRNSKTLKEWRKPSI